MKQEFRNACYAILITAGMDGVFARFYFDRDEPQWRRQIISLYLVIESVYPALIVFPRPTSSPINVTGRRRQKVNRFCTWWA